MLYLAEAVKLKSIIRKKIEELNSERHRVAFATIAKGQEIPSPKRTLQDVEQDLIQVRRDFEKLDALIYRANVDHHVQFDAMTLTIVEAIEHAIQLRAEAQVCKDFSAAEVEEYMYGMTSESEAIIRIALFDPEEYRMRAIELDKKAHTLSNTINAKNYTIQIDFDNALYFG